MSQSSEQISINYAFFTWSQCGTLSTAQTQELFHRLPINRSRTVYGTWARETHSLTSGFHIHALVRYVPRLRKRFRDGDVAGEFIINGRRPNITFHSSTTAAARRHLVHAYDYLFKEDEQVIDSETLKGEIEVLRSKEAVDWQAVRNAGSYEEAIEKCELYDYKWFLANSDRIERTLANRFRRGNQVWDGLYNSSADFRNVPQVLREWEQANVVGSFSCTQLSLDHFVIVAAAVFRPAHAGLQNIASKLMGCFL